METPPLLSVRMPSIRRHAATLKLLFIAGLVLVLHVPLHLVNGLRQERTNNLKQATERISTSTFSEDSRPEHRTFDTYRMVERALKHAVFVLALVFTAFFLFEMLAGLRLHPAQYGLVGAALCLFYLALLALGEVVAPAVAYVGAAVASSSLIVLYSAAILRAWSRAGLMASLLAVVHSVLFVVLRMENLALLAGTAALFVALAVVMYFTRNVDWYAQEAGSAPKPETGA